MKIITPQFWHKKTSLLAFVLLPLSLIYYAIFKIIKIIKNFGSVGKIKLTNAKIICFGNVVMGGSGKTPSCIFLAKILINKGYNIAFLTKGYGRKSEGFFRVESADAALYGDEPILLSQIAPTFVYSKASEILKLNDQNFAGNFANNFDFIIMDDGFQNNKIYKDLAILVHDFDYNDGNGFLFPSGPLRCLKRDVKYDFVFNIMHVNSPEKLNNDAKNIFLQSKISGYENFTNHDASKFYAFAGIARCEKFFKSLANCGIKLLDTIAFADHYFYTQQDLIDINAKFCVSDAIIFTTQKDYVKIKNLALNTKNINASDVINRIKPIDIDLHFSSQNALQTILQHLM